MKMQLRSFLILACLAATGVHAEEDEDFVKHPIGVVGFTEWGQIMNGLVATQNRKTSKYQPLQRSGMGVAFSSTYKEHLDMKVALGGIFWYSLPEFPAAHERMIKSGVGIGEISGDYHFSEDLDLKFGYFGKKYNPDSKNLGEYLYRSGTYPSVVMTGGFELTNTAGAAVNGVQLSYEHLGGKLHHELNVFMERGFEPNYDLSPNYLFNYKPHPVFEIGGGAYFAHLVQLQPDKVTPRARINSFDKTTNKPLEGDDALTKPGYAYYGVGDARNDIRINDDSATAGAKVATGPHKGAAYVSIAENGTPENKLGYYTFAGTKLMMRASISPQAVIQSDMLGPDDLKLYGEVAILGVKNYPFYYDKMSERMPMMIGFNLPAFKLLDVFSVELEYFKNSFPDDIAQVRNNALPIHTIPNVQVKDSATGIDRPIRLSDYAKLYKSGWGSLDHSLKWTVYAKRSINKALSINAMMASDHTHPIHFFGDPDDRPFTRRYQDWYYSLRVQTGF